MEKAAVYEELLRDIGLLCAGENDPIALMSTIVCELHNRIDYFHWTGFYRTVAPETLKVGPYQGGHGCLTITYDRGVCGKAAREQKTQIVDDVNALEYHIACSSSTVSEIVVPVLGPDGKTIAVLDVDSDLPAQFDEVDQRYLEQIVALLKQP